MTIKIKINNKLKMSPKKNQIQLIIPKINQIINIIKITKSKIMKMKIKKKIYLCNLVIKEKQKILIKKDTNFLGLRGIAQDSKIKILMI